MTYRVIGLMSGSSLDGLDLLFTELHQEAGKWRFEMLAADCYPYDHNWTNRLRNATSLNAYDYQLLHTEYGHYTGQLVNRFIEEHNLHYKVGLIASHGHTTFHAPEKKMTAQLGDGAAIAAQTHLPVVSDLRALDVAFGGQGAPIVPIAEKLLLGDYDYFLNLGGIANISVNDPDNYIAFDICAANRVLNMIAETTGASYDEGGKIAASGRSNPELLNALNALEYYNRPFPKSLANSFGVDEVYPLLKNSGSAADQMRTYVKHIAVQVASAIKKVPRRKIAQAKMLVTGGGAFNDFLIENLRSALSEMDIDVIVPDKLLVAYKEALAMALIGVLRWRQEYNVLSSVTGAERNSIGGAVWIGQEG